MYGKDLTGLVFGKLTVLNAAEPIKLKDGRYNSAYRCRCECGVEKIYIRARLTQKRRPYQSCGCTRAHSDPETTRLSSAKRVYNSRYRDGNLSFDEFMILSQKSCYYCGCSPSNMTNRFASLKNGVSDFAIKHGSFVYNGLDRKDNSLPHNKTNLVPCCWICNDAKGKMTLREFKAWIRKVYNHLESTKR